MSRESVQFVEIAREAYAAMREAEPQNEHGLPMYCESCGKTRRHIVCRVEGNDEIFACTVCFAEKWFKVR